MTVCVPVSDVPDEDFGVSTGRRRCVVRRRRGRRVGMLLCSKFRPLLLRLVSLLRVLINLFSCWVSRCSCLASTTTTRRHANLDRTTHHFHCASPRASPRARTPTAASPSPATGSVLTTPSAAITCFCLVDIALCRPFPVSFPLLTTNTRGTDSRLCLGTGYSTYLYLSSKRCNPTWISSAESYGLDYTFVDSRGGCFPGQTR